MGVVLDGLQNCQVREPALGRRARSFQHRIHRRIKLKEFGNGGADDFAANHSGGGLAKQTSFHRLAEIGDDAVFDIDVYGDGGTAQFRLSLGGGVRLLQPLRARDIRGQFENFQVVDVVEVSHFARFRHVWELGTMLVPIHAPLVQCRLFRSLYRNFAGFVPEIANRLPRSDMPTDRLRGHCFK